MKTVTAEKGQYGQWVISGMVNGYRAHKQYYGLTKREAIKDFLGTVA